MTTTRLEAFSDAVIAIIITIMVLELKIPHGADLAALRSMTSAFVAYLLSFVFLGIYWNNHHHLLQVTERVGGGIMWANLHLLFWLSLLPAATAWIGENPRASLPAAVYGVVFFGSAIGWMILERQIIAHEGPTSMLATAVGDDLKGKISAAMYASAIPLAFVHPWISDSLYVAVALIWLVPDRRIEDQLARRTGPTHPA